jgi:hypothetical protein
MITAKTQKKYIDSIRTSLTPLKAVRAKCIDCSGSELKEVRNCSLVECPLYHLRMGKGSRSILKRIRAYCLWCCNGQRDQIKLCPSVRCPLWEYRFGKRPKNTSFLPENLTTDGVLEVIGGSKAQCIHTVPCLKEGVLSERNPLLIFKEREPDRGAYGNQVVRGRE